MAAKVLRKNAQSTRWCHIQSAVWQFACHSVRLQSLFGYTCVDLHCRITICGWYNSSKLCQQKSVGALGSCSLSYTTVIVVVQKKIPPKICENWQSSRFISCQMATYVGSWLTGVVNDTVCRHVYTIGSDTRSVSFCAWTFSCFIILFLSLLSFIAGSFSASPHSLSVPFRFFFSPRALVCAFVIIFFACKCASKGSVLCQSLRETEKFDKNVRGLCNGFNWGLKNVCTWGGGMGGYNLFRTFVGWI